MQEQVFKWLDAHKLTRSEVEDEVKDYIDLMFAVKDEEHFNEIYEEFLTQIYK